MRLSPRLFALLILALALILFGIFLPTGWYDDLPAPPEHLPEPPIAGVTLVRLCFVVEGLLVLLWTLTAAFRGRIEPQAICTLPAPDGADLMHPLPWVLGATALALGLRLFAIGNDLWIDEIVTVLRHEDMSPFQILTVYTALNNHLLNTLAIKATTGLFGVTELTVRFPAVVFGVLGIPAFYKLSRLFLGRRHSVAGSFLLAVSYHHVFFSQSARGYISYLFFTTVATTCFLKGVSRNRHRDWFLYVVAAVLGIATLLNAWFVLAGHMVAALFLMWSLHRNGKPCLPLVRRLVTVGLVVGVVGFHVYANIAPHVYLDVIGSYRQGDSGFKLLSFDYFIELTRGIALAFGRAAIAGVVAIGVAAVGFIVCLRRHPLPTIVLVSPLVVMGGFVLVCGLRVAPRFFIWALPAAYVFLMVNVCAIERWIRQLPTDARIRRITRPLPGTLLVLLAGLSLASLRTYYAIPKQPTRQSLEWVLGEKDPDDLLVCAYLSEWGPRFYGAAYGLEEGRSFLVARSMEALATIEQANPGRKTWLLTTFPRALRKRFPDLHQHILDRYDVVRSFPSTIGDGHITVWKNVAHVSQAG